MKVDIEMLNGFSNYDELLNYIQSNSKFVLALPLGQRAFLAARLAILKSERRRERAAAKESWLQQARRSFRPGDQSPCVVCKKYESVTHAHHVLPLWQQYDKGFTVPVHEFVWLCPTHHAGVHLFLAKKILWPDTSGFSRDETDILIRIALSADELASGNVNNAA